MSRDSQTLAEKCIQSMWSGDEASRKLGMKIVGVGEGWSEVTMPVREDMINGHKTIHGGMVFTLADSALAFACNSKNRASFAMSCGIDFIRPAFLGDVLTARAEEKSLTRSTGFYDVTVTNQDNRIVAHFQGRTHSRGEPLIDIQEEQ